MSAPLPMPLHGALPLARAYPCVSSSSASSAPGRALLCKAASNHSFQGRAQRGPTLAGSPGFPGAIRDGQHSASRHGRRTPDLPRHVFLRGLASLDVRDGASLAGSSLSDIQRCSAELGIGLPDVPQAIRHLTNGLPSLPQPIPHFTNALQNPRQSIPHLTNALPNPRQSIPHLTNTLPNLRKPVSDVTNEVLWLFDHLFPLSVSVS